MVVLRMSDHVGAMGVYLSQRKPNQLIRTLCLHEEARLWNIIMANQSDSTSHETLKIDSSAIFVSGAKFEILKN